jgi:hypothetical protein
MASILSRFPQTVERTERMDATASSSAESRCAINIAIALFSADEHDMFVCSFRGRRFPKYCVEGSDGSGAGIGCSERI